MPAAKLGFGRARKPEALPLFIVALMIDLSCPSKLHATLQSLKNSNKKKK